MSTNNYPAFFTVVEVATARGYLIACVESSQFWEPEHNEEIEALTDREVVARALRLWPQGWADFCTYFASDIRAAEAEESMRWNAEAARAARWHLFPARLPAAALRWGQCDLTATAAVHGLGIDLADIPSYETAQWRWIAETLGVPTPVAIAWAVEGRTRQHLARLGRLILRYTPAYARRRAAASTPQQSADPYFSNPEKGN
ncbi:hypothetical protein [Nocardia altamirensis]|uniref:hypothetical protein n=1 Tax=Nocardia altamirensis TaxID=472158 RepID=UPI0008405249|nr:hypothetical protein [Nocardia altamirensis]